MPAGARPRLGTCFLRTNGEKKNLTFTFALAGLFVSALMHSEFCRVLFGGFLRGGSAPQAILQFPDFGS